MDQHPWGGQPVETVAAGRRRHLARSLMAALSRWGYEERSLPPWLDYEAVRPALRRFAGEGCKFIGPEGDVRLLLPDGTLGVLGLWLEGGLPAGAPARVAYEIEVYRSVGGPWRRLRQVGAELFGVPGPLGDAEILGAALDALSTVHGLRAQVVVNDVRVAGAVASLASRAAGVPDPGAAAGDLLTTLARGDFVTLKSLLFGTLQSDLSEQVWQWLSFRGSSAELRLRLTDFPPGEPETLAAADALADLEQIMELAAARASGENAAPPRGSEAGTTATDPLVDLGLVRDLGYYDGFVFQIIAGNGGVDEVVAAGGRYDSLTAAFGRNMPAAGLAVDLDALALVAGLNGPTATDYAVSARGGQQALRAAWREAARLRDLGFSVTLTPPGREDAGDTGPAGTAGRVVCTDDGVEGVTPPANGSVPVSPVRPRGGMPDGVH